MGTRGESVWGGKGQGMQMKKKRTGWPGTDGSGCGGQRAVGRRQWATDSFEGSVEKSGWTLVGTTGLKTHIPVCRMARV